MPLAGKTGTTDGLRDSWFVGFGSDVLAAVWLGADDNRPIGLTGASGAMRVWYELMKERPPAPLDLAVPRGVEWQWVDARGWRVPLRPAPDPGAIPSSRPLFLPGRRRAIGAKRAIMRGLREDCSGETSASISGDRFGGGLG